MQRLLETEKDEKMTEKLSIVILTKNVEHIIGRCLEAVKGLSDDIVILDGDSTDKTKEICKRYGTRYYNLPDPDNKISGAELKNIAISKAKHDWIFSLDADEIVSPELKKEIADILKKGTKYNGFYIKRRDYAFLNVYMTTTPILRLYRNSKGVFKHSIHEKVYINGETSTLNGFMEHYSYKDVSDYFARFNKYTTLEARKMYAENKNISNGKLIFNSLARPPVEFIIWYFGKGLWMRGFVGFQCACCSAFYQLVKNLKYYELKNK